MSAYDSMRSHKSLVLISNQLGIPSIVIQHGIVGGGPCIRRHGLLPCVSTKFAAMGKISSKLLRECGMDSKKLIITGYPHFDDYIKFTRDLGLQNLIKKSIYKKLGIKEDAKLILIASPRVEEFFRFTSDYSVSYSRMFVYSVLNAIKGMNNTHIVIKLHPGDRSNQAFHLLKDIYDIKNISILFKYDITNLIVVPSPGLLVILSSPLSSCVLSRIPFNPK